MKGREAIWPSNCAAPAARNARGARRAAAVRRDPVVADVVAEARDERLAARGAAGVFEVADPPGQVAGVDVAQAVRRGRSRRPRAASPRSCSPARSSCSRRETR